jgi:polyhydroxyalkanoate synthesis regulator phasin
MPRDDRFKRYQEAGAEFLETARTRAEEFLRELAKMGDSTQKQAQGAVDDLVEGGRKGTEQILGSIRREITAQLSQLGLATKQDLEDLERRLTGATTSAAAPATVPGPGPTPAGESANLAKKAAATKTTVKKAAAVKAPAEKVPPKKVPPKKAAPVKKAPGGI